MKTAGLDYNECRAVLPGLFLPGCPPKWSLA